MLSDPSRISNATAQLFEPQFWQAQGRAERTPAGRGDALFVEHEGQQWVLRHYRRGGWMARLSDDRYLWTGEARTRPFQEWRLLSELHAAGLPVPAPVAARYQRHGLTYSGDLITVRIPNAQPLSAQIARQALPIAVWQEVGCCIRRFHEAGVYHADLNAHNILINSQHEIFIIDFDRGRRLAPGVWTDKNLARLRRSLDKITSKNMGIHFAENDWQALLQGYHGRN